MAAGGCSDGAPADPIGGGSAFSTAKAVTLVGVSTAADFAKSGRVELLFAAEGADGKPLFALTAAEQNAAAAQAKDGWLQLDAKPDAAVTVAIAGVAATQVGLKMQRPVAALGTMGAAAVIDDSDSMKDNDADRQRAKAAGLFVDAVCGSAQSAFGVFDFGACGASTGGTVPCAAGMQAGRDLLAADNAKVSGKLPYVACDPANVAAAKTAIDHLVKPTGDTPLFQVVLETCQAMKATKAANGALAGKSLAMLVMTDGVNYSQFPTTLEQVQQCVGDGAIRVCTVGLGEGSELSANPNAKAIADLKAIANSGNCIYSAAANAQALQAVFGAVGKAVTAGNNRVTVALKPIPPPNVPVQGELRVGSATAKFTFVPPM